MKISVIKPAPLAFIATRTEHYAIRAMAVNAATPEQQKIFYDWIVKGAGMIGGMSFNPDNQRMTDFNEGRRFVAESVLHFTTTPVTSKGED